MQIYCKKNLRSHYTTLLHTSSLKKSPRIKFRHLLDCFIVRREIISIVFDRHHHFRDIILVWHVTPHKIGHPQSNYSKKYPSDTHTRILDMAFRCIIRICVSAAMANNFTFAFDGNRRIFFYRLKFFRVFCYYF